MNTFFLARVAGYCKEINQHKAKRWCWELDAAIMQEQWDLAEQIILNLNPLFDSFAPEGEGGYWQDCWIELKGEIAAQPRQQELF